MEVAIEGANPSPKDWSVLFKNMIYDTAGKPIYEPTQNCDCEFTGGCTKCNPLPSFIGSITYEEAEDMRKKISNFKKRFNEDFARKNKMLFHN